jgi:NodT family efflux transporter outer membrane factor (OMF) lipoprotein
MNFNFLAATRSSISLGPRVLIALVAIASGCMVGPNYHAPAAATPAHWRDTTAPQIKGVPPDHDDWWTVFGDPILDRLVHTAYSQNLTLRNAGLRVIEARAQLGIGVGQFFPQVQEATGGYMRGVSSANSPASVGQFYFNDWRVGGDAAWELDVWGRFRRGIESDDASLYASVMDYDDALTTLVSDVATAYVSLRSNDEQLALAHSNVTIEEDALKIATARFDAGGASELDVAQAKSVLANTNALIPQLELARRQAENRLCTLLGMPVGELDEILGPPGVIPGAPPEVAVGIPADLLRRRPDIRAAEARAAAQCAQIGVATSDLLPHFSLTGSIGYESTKFNNLLNTSSLVGAGGPGVRWDILNYGRIINNVRVQDARFEELIATYQQTVLAAGEEADNFIAQFIKSQEAMKYFAQSVTATQRSFDLSLAQYRAGGASFLNVLNASATLVQEQVQYVQSHAAVADGLISLERALGGGWSIRRGKEFIDHETAWRMEQRDNWGDILGSHYNKSADLIIFPHPDTDNPPATWNSASGPGVGAAPPSSASSSAPASVWPPAEINGVPATQPSQ